MKKLLVIMTFLGAPAMVLGMEQAKAHSANAKALQAVRNYDYEALAKSMTLKNFDINYQYAKESGRTLLAILCSMNSEDPFSKPWEICFDMLLSQKELNLELCDHDGWPASCLALFRNNMAAAIRLNSHIVKEPRQFMLKMRDYIDRGANIECDVDGRTATEKEFILHSYNDFKEDHSHFLGLLSLGGQAPELKDPSNRDLLSYIRFHIADKESLMIYKVFFQAAVTGQTLPLNEMDPQVRRLFSAKVNTRDAQLGMTPLMWAAAFNNLPLAKQLHSVFKAEGTLQDLFGDTALHIAVRIGDAKMAAFLLANAPDARIKKNGNGRTPLDIVIAAKKSDEVLDALELPGDKK